ncbi:MAG TPA: DUF4870 domain-containing protein [Anaerolineales bacterium]|nr:DUF4870 domain-containing protein [Anaerolineales bacterium]
MTTTSTAEERIWTVLSHISAVTFGMGILLPVIGWSEQRQKSKYASFQCLQALGYQSLGFTVWLLTYLVLVVVVLLTLIGSSSGVPTTAGSIDPLFSSALTVVLILNFVLLALYAILPVIAAVACALGRDFRYPILGNRLAGYLKHDSSNEDPLSEDHEFRWVAGMGHFSVIIALWGMLVPLAAWLTQGKQSLFLKFQSIQTLIFHAVALLLFFVAVFIYLFGAILVFASMGLIESQFSASSSMIILILFGAISLIAVLIFFTIPLLHILGQWAGYRVLKGEDYRYPLIGRLVDGWISKPAPNPPGETS